MFDKKIEKVIGPKAAELAASGNLFVGKKNTRKFKSEELPFPVITLETDVLVAGGGLAGICAAVAAARNGSQVILVQDRSRLGGNASSEIRMHARGANQALPTRLWRESGIIEELILTESAVNMQHSFEVWDMILYDKVVSEPNITLLLDTAVIDAELENGRLTRARALCSLIERYYDIQAKFFIDCTGDSTLAAAADAHYLLGREGQSTWGESLAPEISDLKTMGNSLLFFAEKHEGPMPFTPPEWARRFSDADFENRHIRQWEYGYWWLEWGGELDTITENHYIRFELNRILYGVWDYIKNSGKFPEAENWALSWTGMIPGKRESRRILGEHIMTQQEMERSDLYPDRIGFGAWPLDDHPPGGIDSQGLNPCHQVRFDKPYHMPLRSLYSLNRPNLLMAGRNISASHVAFSSSRVMCTCAVVGQAAGTAAALGLKTGLLPFEIVRDEQQLATLHRMLLRDDQSLLEIDGTDTADLARQAKITASAEMDGAPATVLTDGITRDLGDGVGHQWQALISEKPWVELAWEKPQELQSIQLIFDSGLHRKLFLTGEAKEYADQIRGPQPETVADYQLAAEIDGQWQTIVTVEENYLRMKRHTLNLKAVTRMRIHFTRTNGDELARLFEVRVY